MVIELRQDTMIGHWDVASSISQCEFQLGQRLIYVQHPKNELPQPYLANAQKIVTEAWNDIDNAVAYAEQLSRTLTPEFWKAHDESRKEGSRFDVYSIHFNLDDTYPVYVISASHNFEFEYVFYEEDDLWRENPVRKTLPKPPENLWISVRRLGNNRFESAS